MCAGRGILFSRRTRSTPMLWTSSASAPEAAAASMRRSTWGMSRPRGAEEGGGDGGLLPGRVGGGPRRGEHPEPLREVPLDPPAIGIPEAHRVVGGKIGAGEFLRRCDGQDELERGGRAAGGHGERITCGLSC